MNIIQLSPKGEVNSGGYIIPRCKASRYISSAVHRPWEVGCFCIYQVSWRKMKKVTFCKLKMSLSRNFVYNLQTFWVYCQEYFFQFCCKFSVKIIFYLPVNIDTPKFVALLVFVLYHWFIYRSNFVCWKRLETWRHLGSGRKTVNSQGYCELQEPTEMRKNCYSLIW